uniref:Uncharacterized protein n=1 Tax=Anguilla anguilla TaxID=7936 RepID=A0A0E9R5M7_ANGAN
MLLCLCCFCGEANSLQGNKGFFHSIFHSFNQQPLQSVP